MAAILQDGKLRLSGYVGDYYFEDGFTSGDVVMALAQIDDDELLTVYLNSGGGLATEGAAIHALLSARKGKTNVVIEGIAASAASLIAMAGKQVTMSAGAVMMIHDPSGYTSGNSDDHKKSIEALEALATAYSRVYAMKSGKSAEDCRAIMKEERWLSPPEAVREGFADATTETGAEPVTAFDYRIFAHAPTALVDLAKQKNWLMSTKMAAPAATTRPTEEPSMTDKERADQLAAENTKLKTDLAAATASVDGAVKADRERRSAIMNLEEAKGRETLAEHLFNTGSTVDQAKATLAVSPKAAAAEEEEEEREFQPLRMNAQGLNKTPVNTKPGDKATARAVLSASVERLNKRR
ncbi:head maturation protease, ClpP-related [Rhizobium leguminosarum]|uniref:head maturation protease, ClpP-related n=1 Tax=Rhizobium leguminosarum TaxID=384 RepID=UPI000B925DB2|nr:head maturation protease, ClpP-related [Rhizobium leguminosarum]ASS56877.1 peptidase S14 [Rhizobium leguminosarum bv. viciae]